MVQVFLNKNVLEKDIINIINGQSFKEPIKMETSEPYREYLGKYVYLCHTASRMKHCIAIKKELAVNITELMKIANYIKNKEYGLLQALLLKKVFQ